MTDTEYTDRFTHHREYHRESGITARVTLNLSLIDGNPDPDGSLPTINCTLCGQPADIGIYAEQEYSDPTQYAPTDADCYLCTGCSESRAPGLAAAVRDQAAAHCLLGGEDVSHFADWTAALDRVYAAVPGALRCLGFDETTIALAIASKPTSVITGVRMTGYRIVGTNVPGGEIHFMADDADPDGH